MVRLNVDIDVTEAGADVGGEALTATAAVTRQSDAVDFGKRQVARLASFLLLNWVIFRRANQ